MSSEFLDPRPVLRELFKGLLGAVDDRLPLSEELLGGSSHGPWNGYAP
ncbi:hypothetical protein ACIBRY_31075 [Streptomyces anulatus]